MISTLRSVRISRRFLTTMIAVVLSGAGLGAQAQDSDEPIAEVVITGSHIVQQTDQGALPVEVVTKEQIEHTGTTTTEQLLQTVATAVQGNSSTVAASGAGATTGGISTVSLRGLGSQRTLVLIDGQRVSGGGSITDSTSVDINSIPVAALERVEVLKDGASAIYGSDAIAGVVNFILRKDYQGVEVSAYGGGTSGGGADTKRIDAVLGYGDPRTDRYNVMFTVDYEKDNPLAGFQRGFASSGLNVAANNDTTSGNSFPANLAAADGSFPGSVNPKAGNCAPSITDPLLDTTNACRYDPSPLVSLLPDAERYSAFLSARYEIDDHMEAYADLGYNRHRQTFVIQPVPLSDEFGIPNTDPLASLPPYNAGAFAFATILLQPSSPFYPTSLIQGITGGATPDLLVRYRSVLSGNRSLTDTSDQPRVVLGLKGDVGGWKYDGNFLYSETKLTETDNDGFPLYTKLMPLLNSGQVNFFGPNTAAIDSAIQGDNFYGDAYSTKTSITGVSANATREVVTLPAGPLAVAVGAEFRKEQFSTDPAPAVQIGDVSGYGGNFLPVSKARNVEAAYGEINVPIIDHLTADGAVRIRQLPECGQQDDAQDRIALAARSRGAAASVLRQGIPGSQPDGVVPAADHGSHGAGSLRQCPLQCDGQLERLRDSIQHPDWRQSKPEARAVGQLHGRRRVPAVERCLTVDRRLQDQAHQYHHLRCGSPDHTQRPGAVRLPREPRRPDRELPGLSGAGAADQPAQLEPRRDPARRHRRGLPPRIPRGRAQQDRDRVEWDVFQPVRDTTAGWHVLGRRRRGVADRQRQRWRDPPVASLPDVDVHDAVLGRQRVAELSVGLPRPAADPGRSNGVALSTASPRREPLHALQPPGGLYRYRAPAPRGWPEQRVQHEPALYQRGRPELLPGGLRSGLRRSARAVHLWQRGLFLQWQVKWPQR